MNKRNRKGRAALKRQKDTNFLTQAQSGNRTPAAFAASLFLKMLSKRIAPVRKTGTVADWLLPLLVNAWKNCDVKFFMDIARTIKRKRGTEDVHADPAAAALLAFIQECPQGDEPRAYSIQEIQRICARRYPVSERTAGRLAHAAGLKIRPRGAPRKSAHKV
jgi:hypothetical protein